MRQPGESEHAYITRRFKEADNEDDLDRIEAELREEGIKLENIRPRKAERRKRLRKEGILPTRQQLVSKQLTPEMQAFMENVYIPRPVDGADGFWDGYELGTRRARQDMFLSLFALQQLSSLGIQQAKPLVDMAKELRGDVGQAAQAAAAGVGQALQPQMQKLADAIRQGAMASSPNPFASMIAQAFQPFVQQLLSSTLSGMMRAFPQFQQPRLEQTQAAPAPEQSAPGGHSDAWGPLPENVSRIEGDVDV